MLLAVLAVAVLSAQNAQSAHTTAAFVVADVANVRQRADADAPIVLQLRSGAQVAVDEGDGPWRTIAARLGSGRVARGFVRAELIAPAPLDVVRTAADAERALAERRLPDALLLAQRAAAAAPADEHAQRLLADAYRAGGADAEAARVDAALEGRARVHFAQCVPEVGAVVVLQLDGRTRRSTLPCHGGSEVQAPADPAVADAHALAKALAVDAWFELRADGTVAQVPPLAFADARVVPRRDDDHVGGVLEAERVVLGPCTPGALFASAPLAPIAPVRRALAPALERSLTLRHLLDTPNETTPVHDVTALELRARVPLVVVEHRAAQSEALVFVDVLGAGDAPIAAWGTTTADGHDVATVTGVRFAALRFGGRPFAIVSVELGDASGGGWRAVGLVTVDDADAPAATTCELSMTYGC